MIFNINSTRGQTRVLTCVARVTCLVIIIMAGMASWLPHRGELSSKCEEFLAGRSQFDSDHGIPFHSAHERSFRVRCRHRSTAD